VALTGVGRRSLHITLTTTTVTTTYTPDDKNDDNDVIDDKTVSISAKIIPINAATSHIISVCLLDSILASCLALAFIYIENHIILHSHHLSYAVLWKEQSDTLSWEDHIARSAESML
jgi:hypothetical protein